jgi:cellulose synthase/poly-beta-1,6-N-acetylglucosamine synthase-like glycosyltransferase
MHDALILTYGLIVLYWLLVTAKVIAVQRMVHWLHPLRAPALSAAISVVIPARNEERDLASSLRTVLDQEGVDLEVVVVNDHSTDRTGQIADSFAREDMRVKVVHDPPLLAGWLGKSNAMSHGAAVATRSFLPFSDADMVPSSPRSVLSTFMPFQSCVTRWCGGVGGGEP